MNRGDLAKTSKQKFLGCTAFIFQKKAKRIQVELFGRHMMGENDSQSSMFYNINFEQFVTADHPFRKIRALIDVKRIREICRPLFRDGPPFDSAGAIIFGTDWRLLVGG